MRLINTLAVLLLCGCASQQFWHEQTIDPNWSVRSIEFVAAEPKIWCDQKGAAACSWRDHIGGAGRCTIYVGQQTTGWMVRHEMRHCEGWDHPNFGETYPTVPAEDSNSERDL